jgi:hypothetical protein
MRDFIEGTLEEFRFTRDWRYGSKSVSLDGVSPEDFTIDFWTRFNRLEETVQHEWDE